MLMYIINLKNNAQIVALAADAIPKATSTVIVLKERVSFFFFFIWVRMAAALNSVSAATTVT